MDTKYRIFSAILFAVIAVIIASQEQIMSYIPEQYGILAVLVFIVLREIVKEYGQQAKEITSEEPE